MIRTEKIGTQAVRVVVILNVEEKKSRLKF